MATECRSKKHIARVRATRLYMVLALLVLIGGVAGFFIGKLTAPQKTITVTDKVEVPVYESDMLVQAVSSTNDYGLMQINKVNHSWLAEKYRTADMMNPYQNVFCGISIIGQYIEKYSDYGKALMAYNMGNYGAQKAWENGVNSTKYSESILALMEKYEEVSHDK